MRARPIASLLLVASATWLAAGRASAQGRDDASAQTLFTEGRAALEAGRLDEACGKLEESHRLDPAPGTLLNLAECEEKRGRFARAWGHVTHAIDLLPPNDDRRGFASARAKELEARVAKLAVRVAPEAHGAGGARVLRDGVEVPAVAAGVLFPVDPGKHEVSLVHGGRAHAIAVSLAEGESRVVVLDPRLAGTDTGATGAEKRPLVGPFGLATGAGALAALTLGATAGVVAIGHDATMNDHCNAARLCDAAGVEAGEQGRTYATLSTASFIAGGVLAAAAVYFVLTGQ